MAIIAAVRAAQSHERWGQLLLVGICDIIIAAAVWFYPGLAALGLLYLIAFWAFATGVLELIAAFELRKQLPGEWWWVLAGVVSIVFGALLLWHPAAGALAVLWLIGSYAIVFGVMLLGLAFRLRGHLEHGKAAPASELFPGLAGLLQ